ncbi:MAG: UbiA family prenyltransferase [archaeon]|nr:UbiA family prenyltransferase [archaeon]
MNKYLRLFRFGNGVMGIIGLLVSIFIATGYNMFDQTLNIILGCVIVLAFVAGGNALNDYIDVEIDRTAHPDRPLPMGEMEPRTAQLCGYGGLILAVVLSIPLGWIAALLVIVCAAMMFGYETALKQRGFIGNICIAVLTGAVFLFAGSIVNNFSQVWVLALLAALVSVGREIAKDVEDMESDEGSRMTLPMIIGKDRAALVAAVFFILGPLLSFIPIINGMFGILYATVIVADIIFVYCAVAVRKDAHKAEKLAKVAMFVALISFILGVAL